MALTVLHVPYSLDSGYARHPKLEPVIETDTRSLKPGTRNSQDTALAVICTPDTLDPEPGTRNPKPYRGTSLIRNNPP